MEKLARIYDSEILPVWSQRFGRMLLRGIEFPEKGQVLDVACGTGYPAVELLRRMGEGCRLIAIDASSAMLDVARKKVAEMEGAKRKVFFRTESMSPRLSFTDDVYDLVVCNLGLAEMHDPVAAVTDFARVTMPTGQVRCTLPLQGTFQEFYDIFREVLIKHDKHEAIDRLNAHLGRYPSPEECGGWMDQAGLTDVQVEVDEFSMLFKSSREFFFAPVIESGPLATWKAVSGRGQEMQDVFWYIKEAIDAYFGGRAFQITVKAGCLIGNKRDAEEEITGPVVRITDLTRDDVVPATDLAVAAAETLDEDSEDEIELGTDEIELEDLEELEDVEEVTVDGAEPILDATTDEAAAEAVGAVFEVGDDDIVPEHEVGDDDVVLDAFVEGSERPAHLDDD